jgi:translocation and assembly module TamA
MAPGRATRWTSIELSPSRRALVMGLLLGACAHLPPSPDALEVDDLRVEGSEHVPVSALKEKLLTTDSSWWPWWLPLLGRTGWYEAGAWQADLRRVKRFYEARGYYQVRLLQEEVVPAGPGHVTIRLSIREGEPARLRGLALEGLQGLTADQRAGVVVGLPLRLEDIFLEDAWARAKALLVTRLRELGYPLAEVTGEAEVDPAAASVEATLTAAPGLRYRFGEVTARTPPGGEVPAGHLALVVSRDIVHGDWFSEHALREASARVLQLGVFAAVKVERGEPDAEAGTVPVVIDVSEAPMRSIRVGFGLGADLIRQEVRVTGEYVNRNLGLAHLLDEAAFLDRLTVKAKVGWTFLPTVWDVLGGSPSARSGPTARVLTTHELPYLFRIPTLTAHTSLDLSRMLDAAFDYLGAEVKLGVVWRPWTYFSIFPSLNFDAYLLGTPLSVQDNVPAAALGCVPGRPCLLGYLDVTLEFDRRDDRLEPRQGYYLGLSVQGGLASTTSVKPYFRVVPDARGYLSFGPQLQLTLAGRLKAGTLVSSDDDTPVVARFFSGGSSMRGFNTRRFSPQVAVPRAVLSTSPVCANPAAPRVAGGCYDLDDGETLPVGGNGLLEGSLELRWNFWGPLVLAVFTDWGLVTAAPLGPRTDLRRQLQAAVGVGLRYRTPIGPIRLDVGVRLPFIGGPLEVQSGDVRAFRSSPGCFFGSFAPPAGAQATALPYAGSPESLCTFHLSIGEAF